MYIYNTMNGAVISDLRHLILVLPAGFQLPTKNLPKVELFKKRQKKLPTKILF